MDLFKFSICWNLFRFCSNLVIVLCSIKLWIINSSDQRKVWVANLLHTKPLPKIKRFAKIINGQNPLTISAKRSILGDGLVCKRFAVETLLWITEIHFLCSDDINLLSLLLWDNDWTIFSVAIAGLEQAFICWKLFHMLEKPCTIKILDIS